MLQTPYGMGKWDSLTILGQRVSPWLPIGFTWGAIKITDVQDPSPRDSDLPVAGASMGIFLKSSPTDSNVHQKLGGPAPHFGDLEIGASQIPRGAVVSYHTSGGTGGGCPSESLTSDFELPRGHSTEVPPLSFPSAPGRWPVGGIGVSDPLSSTNQVSSSSAGHPVLLPNLSSQPGPRGQPLAATLRSVLKGPRRGAGCVSLTTHQPTPAC